MKIEIIGRNVPAEDRVRQRAEKKLAKLDKFLEEPIEARVTLALEKHLHVADIYVSHRDGVLRAAEQAEGHLIEALDIALEKLDQQARRISGKQKDGKRRGGDLPEPLDVAEGGSEPIAPE